MSDLVEGGWPCANVAGTSGAKQAPERALPARRLQHIVRTMDLVRENRMRMVFGLALVLLAPSLASAEDVKIHRVEFPSRLYGNYAAVVVVESSSNEVACVAYDNGTPVGSGSGYTTARIATVRVSVATPSGSLSVRCETKR
jgi:hypothetical protein